MSTATRRIILLFRYNRPNFVPKYYCSYYLSAILEHNIGDAYITLLLQYNIKLRRRTTKLVAGNVRETSTTWEYFIRLYENCVKPFGDFSVLRIEHNHIVIKVPPVVYETPSPWSVDDFQSHIIIPSTCPVYYNILYTLYIIV